MNVHKDPVSSEVSDGVDTNLMLNGELNLPDYIQVVQPTPGTVENLKAWVTLQHEVTKAKLLGDLTKGFGLTLAFSFVLIWTAVTNPEIDKEFIKEIIPLILTPQITLLGGAYALYSKQHTKNSSLVEVD